MESRKIRYQFDRLPMLLFIACLTITVVAGSVAKRSIMKKSSTQSQATEFSRDVFLLSVSVLIRLREETKYFLCFFLLCGFSFLSLPVSLSFSSIIKYFSFVSPKFDFHELMQTRFVETHERKIFPHRQTVF